MSGITIFDLSQPGRDCEELGYFNQLGEFSQHRLGDLFLSHQGLSELHHSLSGIPELVRAVDIAQHYRFDGFDDDRTTIRNRYRDAA